MLWDSQRILLITLVTFASLHFQCSCTSFLSNSKEIQIDALINKEAEFPPFANSPEEENGHPSLNDNAAQAFTIFLTSYNFSAAWYSKDFSYNQITTGARELFINTCRANKSIALQPNSLYCSLTIFISSQDYSSAQSLGFYFNKTNTYTADAKNSTLTFTEVPVSVATQNDSKPTSRNNCTADVTYYFVNVNDDQNLPFNYSIDSVEDLGIEVLVSNADSCYIEVQNSLVLLPANTTDSWQLYGYVGLMTGIGLVQLIACGYLISKLITNDNLARRIAVGTLSFLITFDFLVYLLHFNYWTIISSWMALIFIVFFISSVFVEPVLLYYVFDALRRESSQSLLSVFYKLYFWMLFSGAGLILSLTCLPNGMFYAYPFFLLPQIVDNFMSGRKYKWNYCLIFGLGLPKSLYIIYLFADGSNIFAQSNNYFLIIYTFIVIILELSILKLQTKWPRLGYKGNNVNQHSYLCNQDESTDVSHELCSICMEKLGSKPLIPVNEPLLEGKGEPQILKTPCKHYYHSGCLKEWTKKKLECPNCRQEMPPMEDDDDD